MPRPDDLTSLFADDPAGPALPARFCKGVITEWDAATGRNSVRLGGTVLGNLALLGADASVLAVGVVVGILVVGESARGLFILGAIVVPS
jgi:hypothetical protein